jgi:hypothetical protein
VSYEILLGDPRVPGVRSPSGDMNNSNDVLAGMGGYFNAWNTAFSGGADPTASTDSTAALNAMMNAAPPGTVCKLPPIYYDSGSWFQAVYAVTSPVTIANLAGLDGDSRALGIPVGDYGNGGLQLVGPLIQPTSAFSGDQVIELESSTTLQYGGQQLRRFTIDGSQLSPGAVWGIHAFGVAAVTMFEVSVSGMTSDGLHAAAGSSGPPPDFWDVKFCKFSSCVGQGVYVDGLADAWWLECECTANQDNGWSIINCNNSRFMSCKAEGNTLAGFAPYSNTGFTGDLKFTACTTEENAQDGFYITGASGGEGIYTLMSCRSINDGSNTGSGGGGYAGMRAASFGGTLLASDFVVQKGASGLYPQYGVSVTDTSFFKIDNSVLDGVTAPFHDGGSNTTKIVGRGVNFGPTGSVQGSSLTDPWGASDLGYAAVAFDPVMQTDTGTANLITAGTLNLIGLQLRIPDNIADLDLWVIGAGGGLTTALAGLYNSAGTLLGHTGSQTSGWASAGVAPVQLALTAQATNSLTDLVPGLYWVALLAAGTTMPSFSQAPGSAAGSGNVVTNGRIASAAVARYATSGSGLSALPTSITPSGFTQSHVAAWWAGIH